MMLALYVVGSLIAPVLLSLRLRDTYDELDQVTGELEQMGRERDTYMWIIHAAQLRAGDPVVPRQPPQ